VYHHGAGFRPKLARHVDLQGRSTVRAERDRARIPASVPVLGRLERSLRYRIAARRHQEDLTRHADAGRRLSDEVYGWIVDDDEFYRRFQGAGVEGGAR
jgi:hypothetical protein